MRSARPGARPRRRLSRPLPRRLMPALTQPCDPPSAQLIRRDCQARAMPVGLGNAAALGRGSESDGSHARTALIERDRRAVAAICAEAEILLQQAQLVLD